MSKTIKISQQYKMLGQRMKTTITTSFPHQLANNQFLQPRSWVNKYLGQSKIVLRRNGPHTFNTN